MSSLIIKVICDYMFECFRLFYISLLNSILCSFAFVCFICVCIFKDCFCTVACNDKCVKFPLFHCSNTFIKSNNLFADTNSHHTVAQNETFNNNKFCWLSAGCHRTNGHLCDARCSVLAHGEILNVSKNC